MSVKLAESFLKKQKKSMLFETAIKLLHIFLAPQSPCLAAFILLDQHIDN